MDFSAPATEDTSNTDAIIVKADEIDESGADISTISPTNTSSESDFNARIESRRAQDAQSAGSPKVLANAVPSPPRSNARPILKRESSAPAPPQQAPRPPPPRQEEGNATDSLSLHQLKRLVGDLPKVEPTAYAYEYEETRSFPEELQEWFQYTEEERFILLKSKEDFGDRWAKKVDVESDSQPLQLSWIDASYEQRKCFVEDVAQDLENDKAETRVDDLGCLAYVALGAWYETAGREGGVEESKIPQSTTKWMESLNSKPRLQLKWVFEGTQMLCNHGIVQRLIHLLKDFWDREQDAEDEPERSEEAQADSKALEQLELSHIMTVLYLLIESSRCQETEDRPKPIRDVLVSAQPNLLSLLTHIISNLRWEDSELSSCSPHQKILLLLWKTLLLFFGSNNDVEHTKKILRQESGELPKETRENFITASPLDYHLFRQEITSKYPAYCPPQPMVPIEPENNSILPPLPNHISRQTSHDKLNNTTNGNKVGGSILNQPVHIATPAPSPPPSPAGPGGKGGKKQNYQTNQNFPFLYPPLDESSNTVGGKGSAELQDKLVGKRWEGGDVPASILEAGQLFASRMRMSRSLRQLWNVREKYIKEERGWSDEDAGKKDDSDDIDEDESLLEESSSGNESNENLKEDAKPIDLPEQCRHEHLKETDDPSVQSRLNAVEDYYRDALPDFQSLIIVLRMELFHIVSILVRKKGPNGPSNGADDNGDGGGRRKTNPNSSEKLSALMNGLVVDTEDTSDPAVENLNEVRMREIVAKAISGIILIMLKWFKVSHILKYEYLTQLLLDATFPQLILTYFGHQDDKAVEQKNDRDDLDFFTFCHQHSKNPPLSPEQPPLSNSSSDSDEAAPPPIRKHRRSPTSQSPPPTPPPPVKPEVDELGCPVGPFPQAPLTNYAPRFFLTNINLLRVLQKITKRKAHRVLQLVHQKSSTVLRRHLKVPMPIQRHYTLKLFKSQVPYCGRKWRQSNMRTITQIYLHCRPELRDEWLCGGDVDGIVDESLMVEQAGRALVHWWHLKEFRDVMEGRGKEGGGLGEEVKEEYDFFARELEKMGWGGGGFGSEEDMDVNGGEGAGSEFEGGPLRMEGWA